MLTVERIGARCASLDRAGNAHGLADTWNAKLKMSKTLKASSEGQNGRQTLKGVSAELG